MAQTINLEMLLAGCSDVSCVSGIRIDTVLEPLAGPGGPVKPAIYEGGNYQQDHRWARVEDEHSTPVIVIDNVPSQANRLEEALCRHRASVGIPEFNLDLSGIGHLPSHLPQSISSLKFPHRNADAYLRDAVMEDKEFTKTDMGKAIFGATAQTCGPLMAWFPQALLYGFWQSHLGKKGNNQKHARAWVSEIVGWQPAATDTKVRGLKGDPLNLNIDSKVTFDENDPTNWDSSEGTKGGGKKGGKKTDALSNIGHGQVPVKEGATPAPVSFARVTQRATLSFAQLRRVGLGDNRPETDAAARALLVALGLHAHNLAFGRGFALRSGAELVPRKTAVTWLGDAQDDPCTFGGYEETRELLQQAIGTAKARGVPLDGWGQCVRLVPKPNLAKVIRETWPEPEDTDT